MTQTDPFPVIQGVKTTNSLSSSPSGVLFFFIKVIVSNLISIISNTGLGPPNSCSNEVKFPANCDPRHENVQGKN